MRRRDITQSTQNPNYISPVDTTEFLCLLDGLCDIRLLPLVRPVRAHELFEFVAPRGHALLAGRGVASVRALLGRLLFVQVDRALVPDDGVGKLENYVT